MAARGYNCVLRLGAHTLAWARNVEPTLTAGEQDITARIHEGWDAAQPGTRRLSARIESVWVPDNASLKVLLDSYWNQTDVAFEMYDEDGFGFQGKLILTEFSPGPQDQDKAVMCSASVRSTGRVYRYESSTTA